MSDTTFGCGAFLPGRGPFNFPDYIDGGNVNDPDPPDPDPPGTKTEADPTDPPVVVDPGGGGPAALPGGPQTPPSGGGGGGGGPGSPISPPPGPAGPVSPGGPTSPGPSIPGAPTAPPNPKECRCVINENRISVNYNVRFDGTRVWNITFNQKCVRQPIGTPNTTQTVIDNFIATLPLGGELSIEGTGFGYENCNTGTTTAPRCNGGCPAISARYSIPAIPDPPAPGPTINPDEEPPRPGPINPQPKPTGGGGPFTPIGDLPSAPGPSVPGGGGGGGVTGAGPQSPGPAPVSPPGGGGGGGGGVVGAGPQSPGPGPVRPGVTNAGPQNPIGPISPGGGGNGYTPIEDLPSAPGPSVPGGGGGGGGGGGPSSAGPQGPAPPQVPVDPGGNAGEGGGGEPIGERPEKDPTGGFNFVGGGVIGKSSENTINNITNTLETTSSIDLGDPKLSREILSQRPSGFEEEEIFFDDTPEKSVFVENTSTITDIFARVIDNNILYLLQNQNTLGDWDSKRAGGVTPTTVYNSLNEETKDILSRILNYDRSPINRSQIYHIIGSRILDGTIAKVTKGSLRALADGAKEETPLVITRSRSDIVNETVALALVEKNYYPLDPTESTGRAGETLKNQKTLASDLDRFLPVIVGGQTLRYYVNDDDTFIGRSTLSLTDGEYFDITLGGETSRIFAESEKDHAFIVPEKTRQIAIKILGGDPSRTLSVSGDPNGIELDYSLTAPRENLYFLSCVLDSIVTEPDAANTRHIKTTTARYENVSLRDIDDINEFIKYKNNHQTFVLDDDDRLLDYVERDGVLYLTQNDIIVDSPKENKTMPLLTRQIPWYILLYPSNKPENNPFNGKSQIVDITPSSSTDPGSITRQLKTRTSINPKFRNTFNQFVSTELVGRDGVDLLGVPTTQARINKINLTNKLINSGYVNSDGEETAAATYNPNRGRTGYRLLTEIIKDLDNNYLLGLNGIGKSLTEFDVLSRLNFKQFNMLSRMENYNVLKQSLFNGMVNNVKVTPGTKNSDSKIAIRKTQLVRRRSTAAEQDQYPEIKSTNFNRAIAPPTTEGPPEFTPYEPPAPPTALP